MNRLSDDIFQFWRVDQLVTYIPILQQLDFMSAYTGTRYTICCTAHHPQCRSIIVHALHAEDRVSNDSAREHI